MLLQRGQSLYALPYAKPQPGSRPANAITQRRRSLAQPNPKVFSTANPALAERKRRTTQGPSTALNPRPVTAPALDRPISLYQDSYTGARPVTAGAARKPLARYAMHSPRNRNPESNPRKPLYNASTIVFGAQRGPRVLPANHFRTTYKSSYVRKPFVNPNAYRL